MFFVFNASGRTAPPSSCSLSISANSETVCKGGSITLKANGASNYIWSTSQIGDSVIVKPEVSTTYTVYANCNGVLDSATITINLVTPPQASFSFTPDSSCANTEVIFTNTSPLNLKYAWNFGDVQSGASNNSNLFSAKHTFETAIGVGYQNYDVKLTVYGAPGCTSIVNKQVHVKQMPNASLEDPNDPKTGEKWPDFTHCKKGVDYILTVKNKGVLSSNNLSYTINWGDNTPDTTFSSWLSSNNIEHLYSSEGYFKLLLSVTGKNGCVDTTSYSVYKGTKPSIGYAPDVLPSSCANPSTALEITITSFQSNSNGTQYTFFSNNGDLPQILTKQELILNPKRIVVFDTTSCGAMGGSTLNTFFLNVDAKNQCGNTPFSLPGWSVSQKPIAKCTIKPDSVGCVNKSLKFVNISNYNPGVLYNSSSNTYTCEKKNKHRWIVSPSSNWEIKKGRLGINNLNIKDTSKWGSDTLELTFKVSGTYTISVVAENDCGKDTMSKVVCIEEPPVPAFLLSKKTFCSPDTVSITNKSNFLYSCKLGKRKWTVAKLNSVCLPDSALDYRFAFNTNDTTPSPVIHFNNQGTYLVKLKLTTACDTFSVTDTIKVKSKPQFSLDKINNACGDIKVGPSLSKINCGNGTLSYQWSFGGGIPSSSNKEIPDSVLFSGLGKHVVSLSLSNECGLTSHDTSFVIAEPPVADAGIGKTLCAGDTVMLKGSITKGIAPYIINWTSNSGSFNSTSLYAIDTVKSNTTYLFKVTDGANCVDTASISFITIPTPVLTVNSPSICSGDSALLIVSGEGVYLWSTGSNSDSIYVQPNESTSYTVSVNDEATGCTSKAVSKVTVNQFPDVNAGTNITVCNQPIPTQLSGFSPLGGLWSGQFVSDSGVFQSNLNGDYTLYYSYSDSLTGCSRTDSLVVTVVSPQSTEAGENFNICINDSIKQLAGFSPPGGNWSGVGVSGVNFNASSAGVGSFILKYSYGAGSCLTKDSLNVTVLPIPALSVDSASICSGKAAILTAKGADSYLWSTGQITDSILVNPNVDTNYSVTGVDTSTGCSISKNTIVRVNNLPKVMFSQAEKGCQDSSVAFTNASTGAKTYQWLYGDGKMDSEINPIHSFTDTGTYVIKLIATTDAGCMDSVSGSIRIFDFPKSKFTVLKNIDACAPLNVSFENSSSGINSTFLWTLGNGDQSIDTIPLPVVFQQGLYDTSYVIELSVANFCGTSVSKETVIVKPKPVAIFGAEKNQGCTPFLVPFSNSSTGNATIYSWDYGDGSIVSTQPSPPPHTFITGKKDTIYIVTLRASNACGSDTAQQRILVKPNTVNAFFNIDPPNGGCAPLKVTFTSFSTDTINGYNKLFWDLGNGDVSTKTKVSTVYNDSGNFICKLRVDNGCSKDSLTARINVYSSPPLSFRPDTNIVCAKTPLAFLNTSTDCKSFSWKFGDNSPTDNRTNPTHSYQNSGTYTVSLSGSGINGSCNGTITHTISVKALPVPVFKPDVNFGCVPLTVAFTDSSKHANFYIWNFGDGNTKADNSSLIKYRYDSVGVFNVKLLLENLDGCKDSASTQINVNTVPKSAFTLSKNFTCSVPVTIKTINKSEGAVSFDWKFANGLISTKNNPDLTYRDFKADTVFLIATNTYNCKDTSFQIFEAIHPPVIRFEAYPDTGCQPLTVSFNDSSQYATSYVWKIDSREYSNKNAQHTFYQPGNYSVYLKASNSRCSDSVTKQNIIVVNPKPKADYDFSQYYINGLPNGTIKFTDNSEDAVSYLWDFGDSTAQSEEINPIHQFPAVRNFMTTLYITNSFQCIDTITKIVIPDYFDGLFIPNAFMPGNPAGGDSKLFLPKGKLLKNYRMQIFNSYGIKIFETTLLDDNGSPVEGWDGSYNGMPCQQDVYVWEIEAEFDSGKIWSGVKNENGRIRKTGTLTLLK